MFSQSAKLLPVTRRVQYSAVEKCRRGCTSSLYITGDRANESCAVLTPYLDLDLRFQNMDSLIQNVESRGMSIDLHQLKSSWNQYSNLKKYRLELEKQWSEVIAKYKSAEAFNSKMLQALDKENAQVKDRLKIATKELWNLEKVAVIGGLSLPNDINPETPLNKSEKIIHIFGSKPESSENNPNHLEVAEKLGLIEYYDSSYYFLKDEAAQFELGTGYMFMDSLRDLGFVQTSNYDFSKSVCVEGVGMDPGDASSVFTLEKESDSKDAISRLHLVGGASLVSFCALHSKTITHSKNLPLRYVTMGRHYNPDNSVGLHGLFSTWQSSAVEAYVLSANANMAREEFQLCLKKTINLYESLGYHFRVEYLPPMNLKPWESLRASFQMFSKCMQCYIEVGSLSICDDHISRRLLMCCEIKSDEPLGFTHVIAGTVVSIPRLLGCVLEYDSDSFKVPSNVAAAIM